MRLATSAADAAILIPDGARLMFGGFMGVGTTDASWMHWWSARRAT
jgi:acetate CoA/acetoacetate CoA-transferase alpha subunit